MIDLIRMKKLLELTTSAFDVEALTAIRMANIVLLEENMTWSEFVDARGITYKTVVIPTSEPPKPTEPVDEIRMMLDVCLKKVKSPSGLMFIQSLGDYYISHGDLSDKQYHALEKWYYNVI